MKGDNTNDSSQANRGNLLRSFETFPDDKEIPILYVLSFYYNRGSEKCAFFGFGVLNSTPVPLCTLPICCDFYVAKCFFNSCFVVLKYTFGTGRGDLNLMM